MVGLTRLKLNPQLVLYLNRHSADEVRQLARARAGAHPTPRTRRICDRLSEHDVLRLVLAFKLGAPKWVLAEHYGIGMKNVKRILRTYGVRKRSKWDVPLV